MKWVIMAFVFANCTHNIVADDKDIPVTVCEPVISACEARQDADLCHAAITCFDLLGEAKKCMISLNAAKELCGIDAAERESEIVSLKHQRWMYGVVGIAVGMVVTGLTIGLTR